MGKGLVDLHPAQGFAAETTSAAAILASAHMGFGLSTTQVCSGSVIGSGAGRNLRQVRWGTARKMVYGWMLTLPAAAVFGAIAAAIALTGPLGVIVVLAALLTGSGVIVLISRRTAVTRHNVNDSRDVTVQFAKVAADPVLVTVLSSSTGRATAGTKTGPTASDLAIPPIIIRQAQVPPPANDTTTAGSAT
jgi:PiT family inorganic phosphate transporter